MKRLVSVLVTLVLVTSVGCGGASAVPDRSAHLGSPTTSRIESVPVHGFSVDVYTVNGSVSGELLAIDNSAIYVNTGGSVQQVPVGEVRRVEVEAYESQGGGAAAFTVVGALSTFTHGFFLVISMPIWLVSGGAVSAGLGLSNDFSIGADPHILRAYARYPQGMPGSVSPPPAAPVVPAPPASYLAPPGDAPAQPPAAPDASPATPAIPPPPP